MRFLVRSLACFFRLARHRGGVLGTTSIVAAFLVLATAPALADCAPSSPGVVVCTGADNDGYANTAGDPQAVTVSTGATINSGGISLTGPGDESVVNSGTINGSIAGDVGGVAMTNMSIYGTGNTNFAIDQNGAINQNIGMDDTTGTNTLTVRSGHSVNIVGMDGGTNIVDNAGQFNSTLTMTSDPGGQNAITNRTGAQLNTIVLNGTDNVIDNAGTINQSITIGGGLGGSNNIVNRAGAVISGNINTVGAAAAEDRIDNDGVINNGVTLGAGDDYFVNRASGVSGDPVTNGTIDMGADDDYVIMADGTINGQILLGTGTDVAAISGGRITTSVDAGPDNDFLLWSGGTVSSGITMNTGDDSAILSNLTSSNLTPGLVIDGGLGNDRMAWQNTQNAAPGAGTNVDTLDNWEVIALARNSHLTFEFGSDTLVLGDTGTLTGQLIIDGPTSSVIASSPNVHTVTSAVAGNPVLVGNAGVIDMVTGSSTDMNRFVIMGNYVGNGGTLALQTFLDTDSNTLSDQLVIDASNGGGSGTGVTGLSVTNFGGPGAQTNANGILVVDALNGATTNADAFTLSAPVAAGIYEYMLFQGGVTADATTDFDWFLRSSVSDPIDPPEPPVPPTPITPTVPIAPSIPVPPPVPPQPPQPPLPTDPTPITPTVPPLPPTPVTPTVPVLPLLPTPVPIPMVPPIGPGGDIPLIRPEIPGYVIAPLVALDLGLESLGTFHERRGNQSFLEDDDDYRRFWIRAFGEGVHGEWTPSIEGLDYQMDPKFDGQLMGLQLGGDVYGNARVDGSYDRFGLFFAHGQATGGIIANSLAQTQIHTGRLNLMSDGVGAYWTFVGDGGWYLDAVGMASWLHGDATSDRGIGDVMSGYAVLGSAEVGLPLPLEGGFTVEPQGQLIVQHVALGDAIEPFTSIDYAGLTSVTGRLGVRLETDIDIGGQAVQVFGSADLWHRFLTESSVQFNNDTVHTSAGGTSLELQAGLNTQLAEAISAFGAVSYEMAVDGGSERAFAANVGLKIRW